MYLCAEHIDWLIKGGQLISDRKIEDLEGSMLSLTVRQVYVVPRHSKSPEIGAERQTPDYIPIAPDKEREGSWWGIFPNRFYQIEFNETFNMPEWLIGFVNTRRTNFISGLWIGCTNISPGYRGPIMVAAKNIFSADKPIWIEKNTALCVVTFAKLSEGFTHPYEHKVWTDGRITTDGKEVGW